VNEVNREDQAGLSEAKTSYTANGERSDP